MGNTKTSQKSSECADSSLAVPTKRLSIRHDRSLSRPPPLRSLELLMTSASSNSIASKTPIPLQLSYQFTESNSKKSHKPQNSVEETKKKFRLFSKTKLPEECEEKSQGNGVTGICVSKRIAQNLLKFWQLHVETLSQKSQLEIAVLVYFTMQQNCDADFKSMFKHEKVRHISIKFLEMIRWLFNALNNNKIDLHTTLIQLGKFHKTSNVKFQYFEACLSALHQTFAEYFPNKYKIVTKYCLDKVFVTCTKIMIGKSPMHEISTSKSVSSKPTINRSTHSKNSVSFIGVSGLSDWNESRSIKDFEIWSKSLDTCLKSEIGQEYFHHFLEQNYCYEIVLFLKYYMEFKRSMTETEKFMCGRKIAKTCVDIDHTSPFPINISYETRNNFIHSMKLLEDSWKNRRKSIVITDINQGSPVSPLQFSESQHLSIPTILPNDEAPSSIFAVPSDLLQPILQEMKRLIQTNHWNSFRLQIELMNGSHSESLEKFN